MLFDRNLGQEVSTAISFRILFLNSTEFEKCARARDIEVEDYSVSEKIESAIRSAIESTRNSTTWNGATDVTTLTRSMRPLRSYFQQKMLKYASVSDTHWVIATRSLSRTTAPKAITGLLGFIYTGMPSRLRLT